MLRSALTFYSRHHMQLETNRYKRNEAVGIVNHAKTCSFTPASPLKRHWNHSLNQLQHFWADILLVKETASSKQSLTCPPVNEY